MKKLIFIFLFICNLCSADLTPHFSFYYYPSSANPTTVAWSNNYYRIDSLFNIVGSGSSFDLTAFHSFSGINLFTNGTTFSDSVRITRLKVDTLTISSGKLPFSVLSDSLFTNTRFDTTKNFYRRDTVGFFNRYNLDTTRFAETWNTWTTTSLDSSRFLYRYDSTRFALRWNVFNTSNLDTTRFIDFGDTAHFAHTDTLTTEEMKAKYNFRNVISFFQAVTFSTVAPIFNIAAVFNQVQDFANGLTTTTITASGTATFNGDLVPAGWTKNQSSSSELQYEKTQIFKFKAPGVGGATNIAYSSIDWHKIYNFGAVIKDDTTNISYQSGEFYGTGGSVIYVRLESLQVHVELNSTAYGLANDSGFAYIKYLDPNR